MLFIVSTCEGDRSSKSDICKALYMGQKKTWPVYVKRLRFKKMWIKINRWRVHSECAVQSYVIIVISLISSFSNGSFHKRSSVDLTNWKTQNKNLCCLTVGPLPSFFLRGRFSFLKSLRVLAVAIWAALADVSIYLCFKPVILWTCINYNNG